jgi:hypothetical protein
MIDLAWFLWQACGGEQPIQEQSGKHMVEGQNYEGMEGNTITHQ